MCEEREREKNKQDHIDHFLTDTSINCDVLLLLLLIYISQIIIFKCVYFF